MKESHKQAIVKSHKRGGRPKGSKDTTKRKRKKFLTAKEERYISNNWLDKSISYFAKKFNVTNGTIIRCSKNRNLPQKNSLNSIGLKRCQLDDLKDKCGIYAMVTSDHKSYIGSSVDIQKRMQEHLKQLSENKHFNKSLQSSWDDDAWFGIVEECDEHELILKENEFIRTCCNLHNDWHFNQLDRSIIELLAEKIKNKIRITDAGCWEYTGRVHKKSGYGEAQLGKTQDRKKSINIYTHRVMYFYAHPEENMSQIVRHMCGSKNCCNPGHLAVGSYRDNQLDNKREEMELFEKRFVETEYDIDILMKEFNLKEGGIYSRISSLDLFEKYPHMRYKERQSKPTKPIEAFGKSMTASEWESTEHKGKGVTRQLISSRMERGWSAEKAISTDRGAIKKTIPEEIQSRIIGLYLYGYSTKEICEILSEPNHPIKGHHVSNAKKRIGELPFTMPDDPHKNVFAISPDLKTNIHYRQGEVHWVVDGKIVQSFNGVRQAMEHLVLSGLVWAQQEYENIWGKFRQS